jgi:hypothetical protein
LHCPSRLTRFWTFPETSTTAPTSSDKLHAPTAHQNRAQPL